MKCKQILAATIAMATAISLAVPAFAMTITDVQFIYVPSPEETEQIPDGYKFEVQFEGDGQIFTPEHDWGADKSGTGTSRTEEIPDVSSSSTPENPDWTKKPVKEQEPADISGYADEVVRLVNIEREKAGLKPLLTDPVLSDMAQKRAVEIQTNYSHTRPDGTNCKTIFEEYETSLVYRGENIAVQTNPETVVEAWMNSPGHRKNILREDVKYIGVGVSVYLEHSNGWYCWTQDFAADK